MMLKDDFYANIILLLSESVQTCIFAPSLSFVSRAYVVIASTRIGHILSAAADTIQALLDGIW
jgi:hypothetical protein